jgi:hypothetical protein
MAECKSCYGFGYISEPISSEDGDMKFICRKCNGTGIEGNNSGKIIKCPEYNGKGNTMSFGSWKTCKRCRGTCLINKSECFITTATFEALKTTDDNCEQLEVFRNFRDNYVNKYPALVSEYYQIAPTIVSKLNSMPDNKSSYQSIYDKYLSKCYSLIKANENESAKDIYVEMVNDLKRVL